MNFLNLCVFDLETGGKNPHNCEIIQASAAIINRNSLKVVDTFDAFMKPENMDAMEDDALSTIRRTRFEIEKFPPTKLVWPNFVNWINKHNKDGSVYTAPIPSGYNINGFDIPIIRRYCKKYKTAWDEKRQDQKLFSQVYSFDVKDHLWFWFENVEIENLKFDTIRQYMGFPEASKDNAHNSMQDVLDTCEVVIRLLSVGRHLTSVNPATGKRRLEMKDCFK